jgi:two-component system nitrogen regulation sensor histidine kinase NtrY
MRLKHRFILFIIIIIGLLIGLSTRLLPDHKGLFLLAELIIIILIAFSIHLYQVFIRPINLISAGVQSIKDRDFNTKFLNVGQSDIDQLIDVYNEMLDRIRRERLEKQEQQYFLEKLIQASPSGIIVFDFDNRISSINPAAQKISAHPKQTLIGKSLDDIPGKLAHHLSRLTPGKAEIIALDGIRKYKCQKAHFLDRGTPHYFILIEELTGEILQTEKNAYAKVIRMMSHEVNNSIGAINSILQTILQFSHRFSKNERDDYENALRIAIERNKNLNRFMRNYADIIRLPAPRKESFDLGEVLERVRILMESTFQERSIQWKTEYCTKKFTIRADIEQIELVLLNIVKNAVEAIDHDGTVTVITKTSPQKLLIIRDSGVGILPEIGNMLFSPFFSSKKDGQGIGLTLSREILLNHGFQFALESVAENQTEFRVFFI